MRRRILEAAVREFSQNGLSGGRIDRISRQAGTVDRMLYYHFGNKERLFRTVLEHVYAQLVQAQRNFAVDADDPVASMRELIAYSWDHYIEHPELVRLVITENLHGGRHIRTSSVIRNLSLPLIEAMTDLVESGQAKGLFRADVDSRDVLLTIFALGFFYVSNHHTLSEWMGVDLMEEGRRAHWREHITRVVLDFLRVPAGGAAERPARSAGRRPGAPRAGGQPERRAGGAPRRTTESVT